MVPVIRYANLADVGGLAFVKNETWRSTYSAIMSADFLQSLSIEGTGARFTDALEQGDEALVMERDGRIVGYLQIGHTQTDDPADVGEFHSIYLLPPEQGAGYGLHLMRLGAHRLLERGFQRAVVWAFRDNAPAVRFYERLGAKVLKDSQWDIGGAMLDDRKYGWDSLAELVDTLDRHCAARPAVFELQLDSEL